MRTHIIGQPHPLHAAYYAAAHEALEASAAELKPGRSAGDVFAAHARVFDSLKLSAHRLNACGYSLGAKFTPSLMDPPMFYEGNPFEISPNQVYFLHMIVMDSESGAALCLGRTYLTGINGAEPINAPSLDAVRK
jgi:Xaa-Pro dipeptidase